MSLWKESVKRAVSFMSNSVDNPPLTQYKDWAPTAPKSSAGLAVSRSGRRRMSNTDEPIGRKRKGTEGLPRYVSDLV